MTTTVSHLPPPPTVALDRMDLVTKQRLFDAADRALLVYPGPVGELLRQELLSWMVFGHLLGSTLIMRVADNLNEAPALWPARPAGPLPASMS